LKSKVQAMKSSDLVIVSTFRSTADAQIAKGILDEVGIESMIRADNAGGMYPAISGAELIVRADDVHQAREALNRRQHRSD
jgi:uridine phosphorylase